VDSELYSYSKYKGYHLYVESNYEDKGVRYDGVAQLNGTTLFESLSYYTGDAAEGKLMEMIDDELGVK
jgi:hypothetical protein